MGLPDRMTFCENRSVLSRTAALSVNRTVLDRSNDGEIRSSVGGVGFTGG